MRPYKRFESDRNEEFKIILNSWWQTDHCSVFPILPSPLSDLDISPLFASVVERTNERRRTAAAATARGKLGLKISQSRNSPRSELRRRKGGRNQGSHYSTQSTLHTPQRAVLDATVTSQLWDCKSNFSLPSSRSPS